MLKTKTNQGAAAEWEWFMRWLRDDCNIQMVTERGLLHVDCEYYHAKNSWRVGNP